MIRLLIIGIKRLIRIGMTPFVVLWWIVVWNPNRIVKWFWYLNNGYLNVWQTILFNFSSFPFNIARKFPVFVYEKIKILNAGKIKIEAEQIHSGMIVINAITWRSKSQTRIENYGIITFHGECQFFGGVNLVVRKTGNVSIGNAVNICENVIVYSEKSITIGNRTDITFNTILTDTNSHFTIDVNSGESHSPHRSVVIGNHNWIGNCCSVKPGTKTPDHTIVASSYSVLTKDYTKTLPPYSIIGGCPAKLLKENMARVYDTDVERELFEKLYKGLPLKVELDNIWSVINSQKLR